ncbi:MAG: porin [Gammaproteobacteria bacterium]|nr:porin [Gammaproteobacteria bacterium]
MNRVKNTVVVIGLLTSVPVLAAEEKMADKPGVPSLGQIMGASGINVSGYVDTSYTYLSGEGKFTPNGVANRVFDTTRNSFNLQMIDVTVSKLPSNGFGGLVNLNFGPDADVVAAAGPGNTKEVQQAYVHYANGPLMVIAGKFVTMAGAEVIKSPNNLNFSRSILFGYAIPFAHTGARLTYTVNDKLSLMAGVNNGWDAQKDNNHNKTLEVGFSANPVKPLLLAGSLHSGKEYANNVLGTGDLGLRNLLDLVATWNATDALSFILNYDYGTQEDAVTVGQKAKWQGVAGYVNYKFADKWRVALRAETFDDKDGYRTGVVQKWDEATLTLAHMPSESVELRAEVRADKSDKKSFLKSDGTATDTQNSVALQAIYKF